MEQGVVDLRPESAPPETACFVIGAGGENLELVETTLQGLVRHPAGVKRIYVAADNGEHAAARTLAERFAEVTILEAEHLGCLYERARHDGATSVALLGAGVLPVGDDWLARLLSHVGDDVALVIADAAPLVLTATDFGSPGRVDLDLSTVATTRVSDVVGQMTRATATAGLQTHHAPRTNRNALHPRIGSLVADTVYHHGPAGPLPSRARPSSAPDALAEISRLGTRMLTEHRDEYVDWLRGTGQRDEIIFVLGMHRSGTSCLMGCLEQCGVHVGEVDRQGLNQPRGNHEHPDGVRLNDQLLAGVASDWRHPPADRLTPEQCRSDDLTAIVRELERHGPSGLKDPRLLFTIEGWRAAATKPNFVGSYRHPEAVAKSLWERDRIPHPEGYELWRRYNEQLLELHSAHEFPLVEFDLTDRDAYCRTVAALAAALGLRPLIQSLRDIVERASRRTAVNSDESVPVECLRLFDALRERRFDGANPPESFASLLEQWGALQDSSVSRGMQQRLQLLAWNVGRHAPRRLRVIHPVRRVARRLQRGSAWRR